MRAKCPKCHRFMKVGEPCKLCGFNWKAVTKNEVKTDTTEPKLIDLRNYRYITVQTTKGMYTFDQDKIDLILYTLSKLQDKN